MKKQRRRRECEKVDQCVSLLIITELDANVGQKETVNRGIVQALEMIEYSSALGRNATELYLY
jgi:hypothetical protein